MGCVRCTRLWPSHSHCCVESPCYSVAKPMQTPLTTSSRLRLYVDTSVYGGAFDEEYEQASVRLFEQVRRGLFRVVVSPVIQAEIRDAPDLVRRLFDEILPLADVQPVTLEAEELAEAYLAAGILTQRSRTDALHVALATLAGCQVLVSWNFRHLVNFYRRPLYNAVNVLRGHLEIAIQSPPEIIIDEDQDV